MNMKLDNELVRRKNGPEEIYTNLSFEESIMLIGFTEFLNKLCSFRISRQ